MVVNILGLLFLWNWDIRIWILNLEKKNVFVFVG